MDDSTINADAPTEEWRDIPGWDGSYQVSDLGRVRSVDRYVQYRNGPLVFTRGRLLTPQFTYFGHIQVMMSRNNDYRPYLAHRLVLLTFIGEAPDGFVACHNNGIPDDNRLSNLRWDTQSANQADAVAHGNNKNASKTHCKNNHEFTPENTYHSPSRPLHRRCKTCAKIHEAKRALKRAENKQRKRSSD